MKREPRRACAAHAANHLSSGPARAGMLRARALSADLRSVHAPESLASRTPAPATVSARPPVPWPGCGRASARARQGDGANADGAGGVEAGNAGEAQPAAGCIAPGIAR
jgi:hypothetical protein